MSLPLRVNLADGTTLKFDLEDPRDRQAWDETKIVRASEIRGLSFIVAGVNYVLPRPTSFQNISFDAEAVYHRDSSGRLIGDRLRLEADGARVECLVYRGKDPKMAKVVLSKV